jgi:tetratricopeptide (TPR) repeat protein
MMLRVLAAVAALATTAPAAAQPTRRYPEETADFWREVRSPQLRRARTLLRHGMEKIRRARYEQRPHHRAAWLEAAIVRFRRARAIAPREPQVLFELARATASYERPRPAGGAERRVEEAIELYRELRALDEAYRPADVAFDLGVLHTRQHDFERAAEEYRTAIRYALLPHSLDAVISHGNLAEVTMMAGETEEAVRLFERTIALSERSGASTVLALWGLAVAQDRLGEHTAAIETAQAAISAGGGEMAVLRGETVFFEPPYELHYYEALGHGAEASRATDRALRLGALRAALSSWRQYVRERGVDHEWGRLAARHVAETEQAIEALGEDARRNGHGHGHGGAP